MFRRDASGPMDVDSVHPLGRAAEYALDDDGPAKKRPHSDLTSSFAEPSRTPGFRFGPNTPFLFHAPPLPPPPKFEPYDPSKWTSASFGMGTTASHVEDIDMDGGAIPGSPTRSLGPESPRHVEKQKKDRGKGKAKVAAVEEDDDGDAEERKIATGAITRARRRRKQWAQKNEEVGLNTQNQVERVSRSEHHYSVHMPTPGTRHSEIPAILLGYVQFVFNGSLVIGFLYIVTQFVLAVKRDVDERIAEYSVEFLQEISECSRAYVANRCEGSSRVPAMEAACQSWELCMNRDPKVVGRARVGAETFAGVINSFVDPISWKTMAFTVVTLTLLIALTNSALFNLRAKHRVVPEAPAPHYPPWMYQPGYAPPGAQLGMGPGHAGPPLGLGYGGDEDKVDKEKGVAGKVIAWLTK